MKDMTGDQCHTFAVWYIILMVLILIILLALVWNLDSLGNDLKKSIVIPLQEKVESIESKFASAEAKAREIADRIEGWEGTFRDNISPNVVEKGKLALENLAFNMMSDTPVMQECVKVEKCKKHKSKH